METHTLTPWFSTKLLFNATHQKYYLVYKKYTIYSCVILC